MSSPASSGAGTPRMASRARHSASSSAPASSSIRWTYTSSVPRGVVGPLHVAAGPVQRLGDPAQQPVVAHWSSPGTARSAGPGPGRAGRPGRGRTRARAAGLAGPGWLSPARTQVSLDPPPWLEFTTSSPSRQRDPGQPAGQHPHVVAVVDRERPQVDVPRRQRLPDRAPGDVDRPPAAARSSRAGWRPPWPGARRASASSARGPMTMPVPPAPSTGLSTSWSQLAEHPVQHLRVVEPVGLDVVAAAAPR